MKVITPPLSRSTRMRCSSIGSLNSPMVPSVTLASSMVLKPVVDNLNLALTSYLKTNGVVAGLRTVSVDAKPTTPDETTKWVKDRLETWQPLAAKAGIHPK
jgi:tripartite-type tricarboxylate transporter receptor subunit TctC